MKHGYRTALLSLALAASGFTQTRLSSLHHISTADFLWNKQFVVKVNTNFFKGFQPQNDSLPAWKTCAIGEFYLGLTERFTLGIQAGWKPSLSFKAKALNEKGNFMPTISLEAHNIFASTEASFYKVMDEDTLKGLCNTVSIVASKSFKPLSLRFHVGLQTLPMWRSELFSPLLGLENYFGAGWYVSAEVFRRFGTFHSNVGFSWRFRKFLMISAGLSEVNKYFFNKNNEFTIQFTGHSPNRTGYGAPGIWLTVLYSGNFSRSEGGSMGVEDELREQNTRIAALEARIKIIGDSVGIHSQILLSTDGKIKDLGMGIKGKGKAQVAYTHVLNKLNQLRNVMASETPYDPKEAKKIVDEIVGMGPDAMPALKSVALDKEASPRIRAYAVNMIGQMPLVRDREILNVLVRLLSEPIVDLRIEALIAIGKRKEQNAIPEVELLTTDPEEAVAMTAKDVLLQLKGE